MDENNLQPNIDNLSKKELKKLEKQQKEEKRKAKERKDKAGSLVTWAIALLIVGGGTVGAVFLAGGDDNNDNLNESADIVASTTITEGDWKKGSIEPKVTLLEYSDFQCPACGNYYPILKQLLEEFDENVQFVYRHFPISGIHKNAEKAGIAAEVAGGQGKFWEMHDKLFENQGDWSGESDPVDKFAQYANEIGIDEEKFREDMEREDFKDRVVLQHQEGVGLGVSQTPTFFLDGEKISNPGGYEGLKALVQGKINEQ